MWSPMTRCRLTCVNDAYRINRLIRNAVVALLLIAGVALAGPRIPWRRRIGRQVDSVHITAHKNTPIGLWPKEPAALSSVDATQFSNALGGLCPAISKDRIAKLSERVLAETSAFGVDPFLLAALMYDRSRCIASTIKRDEKLGRFGLTRIPLEMHRPHIRDGRYHFFEGRPGAFTARALDVSTYPYHEWKLRHPRSNLYFAAAILAMFKAQAETLRTSFDQVPHRHFVSHFFYGDRVRGVEPENRVLTARRRLLAYYTNAAENRQVATFKNLSVASPLDGTPRLVLDYFGNKRSKRSGMGHRGIDIDADEGEPVHAVADGRVVFAGVDEEGGNKNRQLTPDEAAALSPADMGPGGLYIAINHGDNLGSIYMHLSRITVQYADTVKRGDLIGTAGRTGAEKSGAHLHLELRVGTDRVDPAEVFAPILVNPYTGKKQRRRQVSISL